MGDARVQPDARERVRVRVGRDHMPSRARGFDQLDRSVHLRPVGSSARLEVIDLGSNVGEPSDLEHLLHRFDQRRTLAPDVRGVHPAELGRDRRERHELLCGRGGRRRIDQGRGDAECAFGHRLAGEDAHPVEFLPVAGRAS
jgi:hypothetical protein